MKFDRPDTPKYHSQGEKRIFNLNGYEAAATERCVTPQCGQLQRTGLKLQVQASNIELLHPKGCSEVVFPPRRVGDTDQSAIRAV